jgi:V8-like Glu-specific endopeptidase
VFRLLPLVAALIIASLVLFGTANADQQPRNPAISGGDGEMYTWSGEIPSGVGPSSAADFGHGAGLICCPPDERVHMSDTTVPILRSIAQLELYDQFGYLMGTCSGTFIGPDAVLTAAHCLYDAIGGWTDSIAVVPGKNGPYEPFGYDFASNWWVPDAWIDSGGNTLFDWGIVKLPDSQLGNSVGWLSVGVMSDATLMRSDFTPAIIGYPGDKGAGNEMWGGVKNAFLNVDDFLLQYDIDTASGQSGSAIFSLNPQQPFGGTIVGIHTTGSTFYNQGSRIDIGLLYDIITGCFIMECTISAYVENGPTITPSPVPTLLPTSTRSPAPTPIRTPAPGASAAPTGYRQGDANCSGSVDVPDIAVLLKRAIGFALSLVGCPTYQDDVNCQQGTTPIDALMVASYLSGANQVSVPGNCVPIGQFFPTGGATTTPTKTPSPTPTRTPTFAPTATKTPTPTPVKTSTATPTPGGVQTQNSSWYYDILGNIWVVGEVINGTSGTVDFVKVTAYFYSAPNQLLATDFGFACLNAMGAGGDSPYTVLLIDPPAAVHHVTVQVTDYYSPPLLYQVPPGLSIDIDSFHTDIIDYVHVTGTVQNNSAYTHDFVKVCSAFYDTDGRVVRTDFTYTDPSTLGPGGWGSFDSFVDGDGADIDSVAVWASANYP